MAKFLAIDANSNVIEIDAVVSALTNFTESNYLYSTKYGVRFTPNSAQTNVDVVLQPKGTGAIIAQQPDGTATGGNNRGDNAVDLQIARDTHATKVASGNYSSIGGGYGNTASGGESVVAGGRWNTASGALSSVGGGYVNTASGTNSTVAGGNGCRAWGTYSFAGGGANSTASGQYSIALGGQDSTASGSYSLAFGRAAKAALYGQFAHANYVFNYAGDAQVSELCLHRQTTDDTPTELFLDNSSSRLTLVNDSILFCSIMILGKKSGAVNGYKYERRVCIAKGTTAGSATLLGSVETIGTDYEADAGADVAITADTTNGSLKIMVTGIAGTTINWIALVKNVEIVKA